VDCDRLQVAAGRLDQILLAAKGVMGKCSEAIALGRAAAKPASDQTGESGGEIVMRENGERNGLAEDGIGGGCALRLAAAIPPEAVARHNRSFRHRRVRSACVCSSEYRRSASTRQ